MPKYIIDSLATPVILPPSPVPYNHALRTDYCRRSRARARWQGRERGRDGARVVSLRVITYIYIRYGRRADMHGVPIQAGDQRVYTARAVPRDGAA